MIRMIFLKFPLIVSCFDGSYIDTKCLNTLLNCPFSIAQSYFYIRDISRLAFVSFI